MGFGFRVEVSGDYALFSRPELKVERVSYDVITPSAARGVLESILWKPAIRYVIDKIYVLNDIRFTNIRRNEVKSKVLASNALRALNGANQPLFINTSDDIQQRAAMVLKQVHYVIEAHFEMTDAVGPTDSEEKFYAMMLRRLRNGQCYSMPYLGTREFPAKVTLWEAGEIPTAKKLQGERDLGIMLYDMEYSGSNITPLFFRAIMKDGMLDLRNCEVYR